MLFLCYKNCSTCSKAQEFLDKNGISFELREITETPPTISELANWVDLSGKDINKFFNTSGTVYKSMNLKEKINVISYKEKLDLLTSDGMLVKRPLLVLKNKVVLGFKENEWIEALDL